MSKPIYVLCLHNVRTGGPEAIHQLSDALIEQGFDARMVYYDWNQIAALEQAEPDDFYIFGPRENPIEEYARYKTRVEGTVPNQDGYIIVLPETLCHLAPKFPNATVLIWWLSVDNGFGALGRCNLQQLRGQRLRHVWQSRYAGRFLSSLQLGWRELSDYTSDMSEYLDETPQPRSEREPLIVLNANAHKVATANLDAAEAAITERCPQSRFKRLNGALSRREVAQILAKARVYIDLGSFPGMDRLPREAAQLGCGVIVARTGAGRDDFFGAHSISHYTWNETAAWTESYLSGRNLRTSTLGDHAREKEKFFSEARKTFTLLDVI